MGKKITTLAEVKEIITKVLKKMEEKGGLKRVYTIACGGSNACFYPMEYFLKNEAKTLGIWSITANEFFKKTPKAVDEQTIVFAMSLGGSTAETVAAATKAKDCGAAVVALTGSHDSKLAQLADYDIVYNIDIDNPMCEQNQYFTLSLAIELLNQTEGYINYNKAMEGFAKITEICDKANKKLRPAATEFGLKYKDEPIIYTIASGASAKVAYQESICLFMEMEWVHSSSIHAAEYFHGPFEVTEAEVPFMIFIGEGPTRELDERALAFLNRYSQKVTIVDVKDLGINIIDDSVVEYFTPLLHWSAGITYAQGLAEAKKHPLLQRRYMGKLSY